MFAAEVVSADRIPVKPDRSINVLWLVALMDMKFRGIHHRKAYDRITNMHHKSNYFYDAKKIL
ncbi:hypothetical protein QMP26_35555 [Enterocloster clostridioformis]